MTDFDEPIWKNWKKNEVGRPVSYGMYWILVTVLGLYLLVSLLFPAVSAQNMSVTDLTLAQSQTVQIYSNGTLLGTYNTTTNGIVLPSVDFVLVVKPTTADIFSNPTGFLDYAFDFVEANAISIIILMFLIGLVLRRR